MFSDYPKILFYYVNSPQKTYEEIYQECYKKAHDYHFSHRKDGFLSERSFESEIPFVARRNAKFEFDAQQHTKFIRTIIINSVEQEKQVREEIESLSDFNGWKP